MVLAIIWPDLILALVAASGIKSRQGPVTEAVASIKWVTGTCPLHLRRLNGCFDRPYPLHLRRLNGCFDRPYPQHHRRLKVCFESQKRHPLHSIIYTYETQNVRAQSSAVLSAQCSKSCSAVFICGFLFCYRTSNAERSRLLRGLGTRSFAPCLSQVPVRAICHGCWG
jgi:hypothetical protein